MCQICGYSGEAALHGADGIEIRTRLRVVLYAGEKHGLHRIHHLTSTILPMCLPLSMRYARAGIAERKVESMIGRMTSFAGSRGQTSRRKRRAISPFSSGVRERNVEPITLPRFAMRVPISKLSGPAALRGDLSVDRPSRARTSMFASEVRSADHLEDDVYASANRTRFTSATKSVL